MSKTWAYVKNGVVADVITIDGDLVPGVDVYTPDFAADMVETTSATEIGWVYDGKKFAAPVAAPPTKEELKTALAIARLEVETGGINANGVSVSTDRNSQAMITGAYSYASMSSDYPIKFKSANGWVDLSREEVVAVALAVAVHVQACFASEAAASAAIDAGTIKTYEDIANLEWPS